MRDGRGSRPGLDAPGTETVLPAEAVTVGRSLRDEVILVAHTGGAHLGMTLDRPALRRLRGLQAAVRADAAVATMDDDGFDGGVDLPAVIPFRRVTAHELEVVDGIPYLTLHATGDAAEPDVHVECRLDGAVLRSAGADRRDARLVAPLVVLLLVLLLLAGIACLALGSAT